MFVGTNQNAQRSLADCTDPTQLACVVNMIGGLADAHNESLRLAAGGGEAEKQFHLRMRNSSS
jgi:hypothetical protein